jgi:aspartate racemase
VGLLATRFMVEQDFYRGRLAEHGMETLVPDKTGRAEVRRIICDELCWSVVCPESRERYREIMAELVGRGAEGLILGCTEITLLASQADTSVPVFDTTALHVQAALDWLLA